MKKTTESAGIKEPAKQRCIQRFQKRRKKTMKKGILIEVERNPENNCVNVPVALTTAPNNFSMFERITALLAVLSVLEVPKGLLMDVLEKYDHIKKVEVNIDIEELLKQIAQEGEHED